MCGRRLALLVLLMSTLGACSLLGLDDDGPSGSGGGGLPQGFDTTGLFAVEPDVTACAAGALSNAYGTRVVGRLNAVRALHGLAPVALVDDPEVAASVQEAALTIVANARSGHVLQPGELCYSESAAIGRHESLLLMAAGSHVGDVQSGDRILSDWLRDPGVGNLGHRRWLLDPFLAEVAFGFVGGEPSVEFEFSPVIGAALFVTSDVEQAASGAASSGFVAYPFGLYPATLVDLEQPILSLSVVATGSARLDNVDRVSYDGARIELHDAQGTAIAVTDVVGFGDLVGVPNALRWSTGPLTAGVRYTVRVTGVEVDGELTDYEYDFTVL